MRLRATSIGAHVWAVAVWFTVAAALSGCAQAPRHDHELRLSLALDPTSLSPIYAFAQDQIALDLFWCQTLVGLDEHDRFRPVLITRLPTRANGDVSADGRRITYHLRRDVRFADGVPLTSADVAFTYRAILEPANAAGSIDQYERIASLTTPDEHTVVIRLHKPWGAAVHVLFAQADEAYGILPKHAFATFKVSGSAWDQKPFGTGPFRVTDWQRGDRIDLEPNPYFSPAPKLRRIVVRIVPNQTTAFGALQTHEVDVAPLNPDNLAQAQAMPALRIARTAENGLEGLYLQTRAAPTDDVHVRRAIAYALDRTALSNAWRGVFPLAPSVFPPPIVTWRAPSETYRHDVRAAQRELDAAGWRLRGKTRVKDGVPLTLLIVASTQSPILGRIAVIVQQQLAALGTDATIKTYPPALMAAPDGPQRTGRFSVLIGAYIGGSDPEASLNLVCADARSGGGNYARYCSSRFEALFADQLGALTQARRERDFTAIAAVVHDEVPLIPLFDFVNLEGVDSRVTGYRRDMLRFPIHPEMWDAP